MTDDVAASFKASKGFEMPPALVILTIIAVIAAVSTLVLPQGAYEREDRAYFKLVSYTVAEGDTVASISASTGGEFETVNELRPADNPQARVESLVVGQEVLIPTEGKMRESVVRDSYQRFGQDDRRGFGDQAYLAAKSLVLAPILGFIDKASVIGFVLLLGGGFGIILATGAIDRALQWVVVWLGQSKAKVLVAPLSFALFSLGGAVFGLGESTIAFVLITVPLAIRLGYDTITGVAMCYMASQVGFGSAFFNPFTVGIAQGIAELPYLSGLELRIVVWTLSTTIGAAFVVWWSLRVEAKPERSPTFVMDQKVRALLAGESLAGQGRLTVREILVVAIAFGSVFGASVGVVQLDWYINEMAALFAVCGVLAALVHGLSFTRTAEEFVKGAQMMVEPALIIALSAGMVLVLKEGQVLDTILYGLATPLNKVGPEAAAVMLMGVQAVLNFFVPSGSGQAAMTMPIVAPLCDIVGLHRQVGVLAYQFGDGFTNLIVPTSAVLMGVLGVAKVPWTTWVKWVLPLVVVLYGMGAAILFIVVQGPVSWLQ
ncbi:MAG: TIGR00366 family protein [Planctomycetota bacterium]